MRRAAKVDQNQAEIVRALRACGVTVRVMSRVGEGFPDLLCRRGEAVKFVECKVPGESMTTAQREFADEFPVTVVHSVDEALGAFGIV